MLNIPHLARCFAVALLVLGLYLAVENLLISAEVLAWKTGASVVSSSAIATVVAGVELAFASWVTKEKTLAELTADFRHKPILMTLRLFFAGIALGLMYHFDISTTAQYPGFNVTSTYFFTVVVAAYVFGPEACIVIASWLWRKARDVETRHLDQDNVRDAENARLKSERFLLIELAKQAGQEGAISKAKQRWGDRNGDTPRDG